MIIHFLVHICGETKLVANINAEQVVIQPPYPDSYGYYVDCWYQVRSPDETRIQFVFPDFGVNSYKASHFNIQVENLDIARNVIILRLYSYQVFAKSTVLSHLTAHRQNRIPYNQKSKICLQTLSICSLCGREDKNVVFATTLVIV